ncbi:MAG: hypothetical protein EXS03_09205 [Phycisphaerales bacterium]|nr:hypothetical protein [Phycisphaerales bacterium]
MSAPVPAVTSHIAIALLGSAVAVASANFARAQSVAITLEHFGVGDHVRPGDVIGIQLALTAELDAPTPVEVAWELPDGNGDIAQVTRRIVLSPGEPETVWLYARIPPRVPASNALDEVTVVRLFEERNGARVRLIGSARLSGSSSTTPTTAVDCEDDLIGVIGNGRMGLDVFATPRPGTSSIPSMNSLTRIARGIRVEDLPDSWEGLSPFQTIIWTQENPQALSRDLADALRQWIYRGGALVIVLPEAAEPWGVLSKATHPLSDLMPKWKAERIDAVPVRTILPILSKSDTLLNARATVPVVIFRDPRSDRAYEPFIFMPTPRDARTGLAAPRTDSLDGQVVGISRTYGHGRVTILGIDVDSLSRRSLQAGPLPEGDIFWNRILSRRADTPSAQDYSTLAGAAPTRLVTSGVALDDMGHGALVNDAIGMKGEAALGILAAFVLFLVYWALAGPVGYGLLSWRKQQRHAWLAFALVAIAFGVGVWAVGRTVSSTRVRAQHLTVIDSIWRSALDERSDEPAFQRAIAWFSAYLPGYGEATIEIASDPEVRNTLTSWSPPPMGSGEGFPNPAIAKVPMEHPNEVVVSARATSASYEANWIGAVSPSWGRMPFCSDAERPLVQRVVTGSPVRVSLSGVIEHRLPGPLRNVHMIHVMPLRNDPPRRLRADPLVNEPSDALPNHGRFVILSEWAPSTPIEIAQHLYPGGAMGADETIGSIDEAIRARYSAPFLGDLFRTRLNTLLNADRRALALDMLGIYSMLQPPAYLMNPPTAPDSVRVHRMLARSIDLSPWFTRPCLIVWGTLDAAECPVPIFVNGETVPTEGTVIVRTVFPLIVDADLAAPTAD